MSSTHDPKGQSGHRAATMDFYETPSWAIDRLLEKVDLPGGCWIEPGAGKGSIIRAVNARRNDVKWTAVEQNPYFCTDLIATGAQTLCGNFLWLPRPTELFDVAIGNPPYRQAMEFVKHAGAIAKVVVMLLRVGILGSEERNQFMRQFPPDTNVLPNRPPYRGKGSDSTDYAWFVWYPYQVRQEGTLRVLDVTPLDQRRAVQPVVQNEEQ